MPEGVEVRRSVEDIKFLEGNRLTNVTVIDPNHHILKACDTALLENSILLRAFNKGKFIFLEFDNKVFLEIHFNMGGSFKFGQTKHSILRFNFDNGVLYYEDIRKFGNLKTLNTQEFEVRYAELGFDLMDATDEDLLKIATKIKSKPRLQIKPTIMNQYIVGGIGNIYAAEGLFKAKILPYKRIEHVGLVNILELLRLTKDFMWRSYRLGGMTIVSFTLPDGSKATGADLLQIYGKLKCPKCDSFIVTHTIAGRQSHYCINCQT